MRPRFMNRGSADRCDQGADYSIGFNEAPIHESGKYIDMPRRRRRDTALQ